MKHLLVTLFLTLAAYVCAIGALSLLGGCAPVPMAGAVVLGASSSSCLTPESAARADSALNLALVEALDDAAGGSITGEELTTRLRSALVTYGQELRTAIVQDTASEVSGQLARVTDVATTQGGGIGLASAALTYFIRELSWRKRRKPAIEKKMAA
jgi:hypothetical protein